MTLHRIFKLLKECDPKSRSSIQLSEIIEGDILVSLSERVLGEFSAEDVKNPISGEIIVKNKNMIDEAVCEKMAQQRKINKFIQ